jgi:hypothetical protein
MKKTSKLNQLQLQMFLSFYLLSKNLQRMRNYYLKWLPMKMFGAKAIDEWIVYRVTGKALDNLAAQWQESI